MDEMQKKVTAKDVAKAAGVSEATVSYILNDRKDVKVAEATRKKILQLCNLMQYTPSQIAKSLATGRNNIIGIQFNQINGSPSHSLQTFKLLTDLQARLQLLNYDTLVMPIINNSQELRIQSNIDGIICIDLQEEQFYKLKENYFVPIISVDMIVPDQLFFKVHDDIPAILDYGKKLLNATRVNFIIEQYQNDALMQSIKSELISDNLLIAQNGQDFQNCLSARKDEYFIIYGEYLANFCFPFIQENRTAVVCNDACVTQTQYKQIIISSEQKTSFIVDLLQNAIKRNIDAPHEIKLTPSNI